MIRNLAAALAITTSVVAIATPAHAQRAGFSIPAGDLSVALDQYARQTGRQVLYKVDEVKSARTPGVHGTMSADAALRALLVGTGSRIARRDFQSDTPISTVDASAIAAAAQPSLDRVIGQMPQFEAAQGAAEVGDVQGSVGFGGGASYSDLRGIGRNRSLVLMDGRRLVPSTPDGSIDLNTIPMSLI